MRHAGQPDTSDAPVAEAAPSAELTEPAGGRPDPSEMVYELLHEVIDPEVGVNIVDLGLIYGVEPSEHFVQVRMTLTTPGCPLSGYMTDSIHQVLTSSMPGINDTAVDIVWDPAWSPEMMTDEAKRQLGWIR